MNIDERLEKLVERHEALAQSVELLNQTLTHNLQEFTGRLDQLAATVAKHELWQEKVERSLFAGIEAAIREWRNGDGDKK